MSPMERVRSRRRACARYASALGMVLLSVLCPRADALDRALDMSQYAHTAWKVREGFTKGTIVSIAQTPDGYLWLGTEFGLLRFDGVRSVPWQPPSDQHLPSTYIRRLLVARDGTLWIGTWKGLASWKDGKLTQYPELAGQIISALLEDREGTVWAGGLAFPPPGKLCAIHGGTAQCFGEDGALGPGVVSLLEDGKGNLWIGALDGLWQWKPGPPKFYSLPGEPDGIRGLAEDDDGALLIGMRGGMRRLVGGKLEPYPLPGNVEHFVTRRLLRDRDGGLWVGTSDRGLVHVHQRQTDVFSLPDGLTGDDVLALFQDREGSVWAATLNGLDRFREVAVSTLSVRQGLSSAAVGSVLADRDGSVWLGTYGGLNRWNDGRITIVRTGSEKRDGKLNALAPNSLFQDDRGQIWVSTDAGVGYLENDRFVPISGVPGGPVLGIAQDKAGNLWIANEESGLFRLSERGEVQQIPRDQLRHKDNASALAADPVQGGVWLGFFNGGIEYFRDGEVRASFGSSDGLGGGRVSQFRFDTDGTVWAATEGGLSRLKNGRVVTLSGKNGLPCDAVHWMIRDNDYAFWLYMPCGLVRLTRSELDAWATAADSDKETKRMVQATVFDGSDGVTSHAGISRFDFGHFRPGGYTPHVAKSSDGKLWFSSGDGVSVVDPHYLPFNKLAPPVHIEQIIADRKSYDAAFAVGGRLALPARVRDVQIDYTALSLAAPEKVLFRYKLEGLDSDWQEAGNRRQAFYTNLAPRNYRFRVMACNNSGVWNEEGASLDFAVAPAYYQTWWFRLSCVAAFVVLLWAVHQMRLRRMAREFNMRLDERVSERVRIAQELHDTLLQTFQALLFHFHAASSLFPDRPEEGKQQLDRAIDIAARAVTEGRDAVMGLRLSTVETNNLASALKSLSTELSANETGGNPPEVDIVVEGAPCDLHPVLRDEVYRIAGEALRNAFRHAQAQRIEVGIHYDKHELRLRIRDDGKGIEAKIVAEKGRPGHYGLRGMTERATAIGGNLAVSSNLESGTEIELTIPSGAAYASTAQRRSWFARKEDSASPH
jgi:signal transduction histidine kinase/ligand-binding sensor domain-containing protein